MSNKHAKTSKKSNKSPSLHFGPGDTSGWTPVGLSSFRGQKQTAAVRELIQNSLDAALAAKEKPSRIRFLTAKCSINDIPAIEAYREAFDQAMKTQLKFFGKLPVQAKAITQDIEQCLKKTEIELLCILDNGIGLNEKRMTALLADGLSLKTAGSTGSFGNGHVVVFPSSYLRYILYGGVSDEKMICSGHAILAARESSNSGPSLSKDGYFVSELVENDLFNRYVFPENGQIPSLIRDQLDWIKKEWGKGSAVIVAGFNRFLEGEKSQLCKQVSQAAACNFFVAIHEEDLVIEIEEDDNLTRLDKESLPTVLQKYLREERSRDKFLSGKRANEAWQTLQNGRKLTVPTELGGVEIILQCPIKSGVTHVDLCRNGMWVTGKLPGFSDHFGNSQPFHCIIHLHDNSKLSQLVSKAEGPLHNDLFIDQLNGEEEKKLRSVFNELRDYLKKEVPELNNESFQPDDIFVIPSRGISQGGIRPSMIGTPTVIKRRPPSKDTGGEGGNTNERGEEGNGEGDGRPRTFKRSGNQIPFQALPIQTGLRSCRVKVMPGKKITQGEIRFALDESIDETCDDISQEPLVYLKNVQLNGQDAPKDCLITDDEEKHVFGVLLGNLDVGQTCTIDVDYVVPKDIPVPSHQPVVLKVDIVRRASRKTENEK